MAETEFERTHKRLAALKAERAPFEPEIRDIAENFAPSRTRLTASNGQSANDIRRRRHANLVNNKPMIAARTMASGLHAGLTSPARPWCKLATPDRDMAEFGGIKTWLDRVENKMRAVWAKSNLYTALPFEYGEVALFATMAMIGFDNDESIIRFEPYTFGQYWIAVDEEGRADTLYKIVPMTVRQMVKRYGEKGVSERVRRFLASGKTEERVQVLCAIEPNTDRVAGSPFAEGMAWQSMYWDLDDDAGKDRKPLHRSGFASNPILSTIWEGTAGESYGSVCPGMMALGPARALQQNMRDKARANQKGHNPPMQAPASMARSGVSVLPGATNYLPANEVAGPGIRPLYERTPDTRGLLEEIQENGRDIDQACYVDLFLMLASDARSTPPTAEEIRARYEEKVLALGPTLEMFNGRLLNPLVDRTFDALVRRSRPFWEGRLDGEPEIPPPPKELQDVKLDVDFISVLQQAQRAASLSAIERYASTAINLSKVFPDVLDKVNADQIMDELGTGLSVPAGIGRDDDEVAAIRAAKAQQQQVQQLASVAPALKDAASAVADVAGTQPAPGNLLSAMGGAAP